MKKIKTIIIMVLSLLILVACQNSKQESSKETKNEIKKETVETLSKSYKNISDGGFYLDKSGKIISKADIKNQQIIEWYTEPRCPACITLETNFKEYSSDIMGESTLIKFTPLSFLGKDKEKPELITYSDNLAAIYLALAEYEPKIAQKYIGETMTVLYSTTNAEKSTEEQLKAFKETYEKLGGKDWGKIEKEIPKTMKIANLGVQELIQNEDMKKRVENGQLTTPLVWKRGTEKAIKIDPDKPEEIKKSLEEVLK